MAKISMRVRAIEGRQVLNPWSMGMAQQERLGHERFVEGTTTRGGVEVPRIRYRFVSGDVVVPETADHFLRRAVESGDLEYVETIADAGEKTEKKFRDLPLVKATARNRKARSELAAQNEQAAKKAEADLNHALDAAERGEDE